MLSILGRQEGLTELARWQALAEPALSRRDARPQAKLVRDFPRRRRDPTAPGGTRQRAVHGVARLLGSTSKTASHQLLRQLTAPVRFEMTATRALLGWRSHYGVVGLLLSAVRPRCNGAPCASGALGMRRSPVRVSARRRLHGRPAHPAA